MTISNEMSSELPGELSSKIRRISGRIRLLPIALFCVLFAGTAYAATLQSAKDAGWIGEKPDGYLGLVRDEAPADVKALVDDVNAKRRAHYAKIAKQQGVPAAEVEKVGGATAIEKTSPGHFVMDQQGRWRRK